MSTAFTQPFSSAGNGGNDRGNRDQDLEQQGLSSPPPGAENELLDDEVEPQEVPPVIQETQGPFNRASFNRRSFPLETPGRQTRATPRKFLFSGPDTRETTKNPGMTRNFVPPPVLAGKTKTRFDSRKYRYEDVGLGSYDIKFSVTRDDRMPVDQACGQLEYIREKCGIRRGVDPPEVVASFDAGLWFCHTVNGASRLNPGRSNFCVPGMTQSFDYLDILSMLGTDARRFFRTYADDIADVNRKVLADYDPYNDVSTEKWSWLMDVAAGRGLVRYPYLAHDSADACLHLTLPERAALAASKVEVLSKVANVADYVHSNARMKVDETAP